MNVYQIAIRAAVILILALITAVGLLVEIYL